MKQPTKSQPRADQMPAKSQRRSNKKPTKSRPRDRQDPTNSQTDANQDPRSMPENRIMQHAILKHLTNKTKKYMPDMNHRQNTEYMSWTKRVPSNENWNKHDIKQQAWRNARQNKDVMKQTCPRTMQALPAPQNKQTVTSRCKHVMNNCKKQNRHSMKQKALKNKTTKQPYQIVPRSKSN